MHHIDMSFPSVSFFLFFLIQLITLFSFFFFNDTATTEIYTLSLHDALPISYSQHYCTKCHKYFNADLSDLAPPSSQYTRSEEHTSELQSQSNLVCRLLLEKKKKTDA